MDITARIDRALGLEKFGRNRAALDSLRQLVRDVPDSPTARLALAGLYRRLGHAEQAGRWSALTPEWATPRERRAFAVFLQQWSVDPYRVLLLPRHKELPPLPRPPRRPGVIRRLAGYIDNQHADMIGPEWIRQPALALWVIGWAVAVMAVVPPLAVFAAAWSIAGSNPSEAATAFDVGLVLMSLGLLLVVLLQLPSELLARNWQRAGVLTMVGVAMCFVFASRDLAALFSVA
jgi:hypothetical protein